MFICKQTAYITEMFSIGKNFINKPFKQKKSAFPALGNADLNSAYFLQTNFTTHRGRDYPSLSDLLWNAAPIN